MTKPNFKFKLGANVQEVISGVIGTVTSRAEYYFDTPAYAIESKNFDKTFWFPENRLTDVSNVVEMDLRDDLEFEFDLGERVQDIITGIIGVIVNRTQYFATENRYGIGSKDIPPDELLYFDEGRLRRTT